MSIYGSKKEELFKLVLYNKPEIIANVLGEEIESFQFETYKNKRYIDLFGLTVASNLNVIIEVQLTPTDVDHYNRITEMYEHYDEAIIVWIASDFDSEMVEAIIFDLNFSYSKFINFYAITFDERILEWIDRLNMKTDVEKYREIDRFNQDLGLSIFDHTKLIPSGYCAEEPEADFDLPVVKRNKTLLNALHAKVPYAFNLMRSKSTLNHPTVNVGAGKSYLTYSFALDRENGKGAYLRLMLTEHNRNQDFIEIVSAVLDQQKYFHSCHIKFNHRMIVFWIEKQSSDQSTMHVMAEVFKRLHDIVSGRIDDRKTI
ncbi:hypothetical protein [Salisediminibacterium beveridgei]|uniref:DUF4268 domain-containing protein n=1 Tax=Salisediminibacterium beveridgei TaxID=632773 RepID=A0A1D7QST0_9BACI|nr:hypothetical protein [Salisediminibacterium beveridgei]AOM82065.1 hypothetical protein BBEV_0693 [Salisediminibacterium beveridgei]